MFWLVATGSPFLRSLLFVPKLWPPPAPAGEPLNQASSGVPTFALKKSGYLPASPGWSIRSNPASAWIFGYGRRAPLRPRSTTAGGLLPSGGSLGRGGGGAVGKREGTGKNRAGGVPSGAPGPKGRPQLPEVGREFAGDGSRIGESASVRTVDQNVALSTCAQVFDRPGGRRSRSRGTGAQPVPP